MNNSVKTFLIKALILTCFIVMADVFAGLLLRHLFYKQRSGKYFTTTHALKDCNETVIIFGSSHAAQHFDAPLMQKELSKTVFNFGNQGQRLFYAYPLIKSILAYHKPKLIILNLDYDELHYSNEDYERLSIFLPYYHLNPFVDSAILMLKNDSYIKAHSLLYRYNSTLGYMLLNSYGHSYNKSMLSLGYDPIIGDMCSAVADTNDVEKSNNEEIKFDQTKINCLIKLINFIQANHVQLLVTSTPVFKYTVTKTDIYRKKLFQILTAMHVNYLDNTVNTKFLGKCSFFHDESHLNPAGADAWTNQCIEHIVNTTL